MSAAPSREEITMTAMSQSPVSHQPSASAIHDRNARCGLWSPCKVVHTSAGGVTLIKTCPVTTVTVTVHVRVGAVRAPLVHENVLVDPV
jgi:hypothetical protein